MRENTNPIVGTYLDLAQEYDNQGNRESYWGRVSPSGAAGIDLQVGCDGVVDVGCGTG